MLHLAKVEQIFKRVPVFNTVAEAVKVQKANTSVIFVPPAFAADAILEAAGAGIKFIIASPKEFQLMIC